MFFSKDSDCNTRIAVNQPLKGKGKRGLSRQCGETTPILGVRAELRGLRHSARQAIRLEPNFAQRCFCSAAAGRASHEAGTIKLPNVPRPRLKAHSYVMHVMR